VGWKVLPQLVAAVDWRERPLKVDFAVTLEQGSDELLERPEGEDLLKEQPPPDWAQQLALGS
jgi:hypothetical protein